MGTLVSRVVNRVSARPSNAATYTPSGVAYDWAVGGLPFLSGADPQRPLQRQTAPYKRDQIDQDAEPGEQTLVSWWIRSQSSFHAGTGVKFEEPDANYPNNIYRFQDSLGVDPWTVGQVSLLPATFRAVSAAGTVIVHGCTNGFGQDQFLHAEGSTLAQVLFPGAASSFLWGGTGTILALADDGMNYYAADSTGIYKGTLNGGTGTKIWNTGSSNVTLGWVKQRLIACIGGSVYDLSPAGTGGPTLPAPNYTHPAPGWVWTSVSETPNDIIVGGYGGGQSAVYRFTLSSSGAVPTLTAAITAMVLPGGEQVYSLLSYLGTYVAVGTNKGVRIASVDLTSGAMQYGPLSIVSTAPVRSLSAKDRFVYAACENQLAGQSGLWRLDMGVQVAFRRFAYATDLQTHVAGTVGSITQWGTSGLMVIGVNGHGAYSEDPANLEPSGYVLTGNIRFHTLEPKIFKYVRLRATPLAGSLAVSLIDHTGSEGSLATYSESGLADLEETGTSASLGPQEYVSLRITLGRDAVATGTGPTLIGYQIKALPAAKRQRNYLLPLLCFDYEQDKQGVRCGGEGTAIQRLEALEAMEERGDTVLLQDLNRDPATSRLGVIDEVRFVQDVPPTDAAGWGGYILLTFRAVA